MTDFITTIRDFVEATEPIWQWLAIIGISAIPFIESYFGAAIGVLAGVPVVIAILAAIVGNWISMFLLVLFGHKMHSLKKPSDKELSPRKEKFKNMFNKYGVAGVSLLGQTLLPSQITSMAMVSFGAPKWRVIFWQTISIAIWGTAFGLLAMAGSELILGRI
ncbi:MAG: hypothetical protein WBA28_08045 [Microbacteriaceae bacterium]